MGGRLESKRIQAKTRIDTVNRPKYGAEGIENTFMSREKRKDLIRKRKREMSLSYVCFQRGWSWIIASSVKLGACGAAVSAAATHSQTVEIIIIIGELPAEMCRSGASRYSWDL